MAVRETWRTGTWRDFACGSWRRSGREGRRQQQRVGRAGRDRFIRPLVMDDSRLGDGDERRRSPLAILSRIIAIIMIIIMMMMMMIMDPWVLFDG